MSSRRSSQTSVFSRVSSKPADLLWQCFKVTIQDLPGYIGQNYLPRWFDMIFLVM